MARPVTIREAVERLGVSRQRVHQLLRSCGIRLRPSGFGRAGYITEADLRVLIMRQEARLPGGGRRA
jgi:hypothetical protein